MTLIRGTLRRMSPSRMSLIRMTVKIMKLSRKMLRGTTVKPIGDTVENDIKQNENKENDI